MWLGPTAIPTVAPYARVSAQALQHALQQVGAYAGIGSQVLHSPQFALFEKQQPTLSSRMIRSLASLSDDVARGLGINLVLLLWIAFEHEAPGRILQVEQEEWRNAQELLHLDEELRRGNADELLESEDILASQQPEIAAFLNNQIEAALMAFPEEIDLDAVDSVYRLVLVEVLALSYAVQPPAQGAPSSQARC